MYDFKALFGNRTISLILMYIVNYGDGWASAIGLTFNISARTVKKHLDRLKSGGVLVSRKVGSVQVYSINQRLAIKSELCALIEKMLLLQDDTSTQSYFRQRRRPVM